MATEKVPTAPEPIIPDLIEQLEKREAELSDELSRISKARKALLDLLGPEKKEQPKKKEGRSWKVQGPPVRPEQVRDFVVEKKEFTRQELTEKFSRSHSWADGALRPLLERGVIQARNVGQGKLVYTYVDPSSTREPPGPIVTSETQAATEERRGPVPGTGQKRMGSRDIRPLLAEARRQGFEVTQERGHITVRNPEGRSKKISATPSDRNAHKRIRRELVRMGLRV